VGGRVEVLVDGPVPDGAPAYLGRTVADAPEIDGAVYVTAEGLEPGEIVPVEIVDWRGYDLIGVSTTSGGSEG